MKKLVAICALGVFLASSQAVALTVSLSNKTDAMLMKAIEDGDESAVQQTLDNGANVNRLVDLGSRGLRKFIVTVPESKNIQQVTLLQYAVLMQAPTGILTKLINAGADVNMKAPGNGCWTALSLAMIINPQAVPVLKQNGADVTVCLKDRITLIED